MIERSVQTKEEVIELIHEHWTEVEKLGVKQIGLFGSFVRNEASPESDVDFVVIFAAGQKTYDNFINLVFLLEDLLQRPVELITPEGLSPYFREKIEQELEDVSILA